MYWSPIDISSLEKTESSLGFRNKNPFAWQIAMRQRLFQAMNVQSREVFWGQLYPLAAPLAL